MYKSKEVNESQFLNNVTLSRLNDTCNGKPQITSTPLNSLGMRRKPVLPSPPAIATIARHGTPRNYSLSEVSAPSTKINPKPSTLNSPGPLLASLSIKDNVSMYQETKSSGLARRIVQYKEKKDKKNEKHYTHQEQYSSPGLFPIVNLFRKKLPVRKLKPPERIMPRMSSPEYLKSLSPMINKNLDRNHLLDGLTRSRYPRPESSFPAYNQNGVETKSVLEALKEISRKRIRSSEEYETIDTGKKAKTDIATSKRTRVDSPPLNSSGSPLLQQSQKKFCNEFDASKSSSDFSMLKKNETPKSSKRKTASTSTESLDNTRQVKVVAVETQTPTTLLNVVKPKEKSPEIVEEVAVKELPPAIEKPKVKLVFNDLFMDNYRGRRLASLMGTQFKKNIQVTVPEPEKPATITEEQTEVQSHPTSILSTPKSNTHKPSEKHVHFTESTTAAAPLVSQPSLTQTSTPTLTPASESPIIQQKSDSIATPVVSTTPTFSFGNPTSTDKTDTSKPSFGFGKPLETSTSPQKLGGFKFDLKAPASTASPAPSISFPIATSAINKPSESSVIVFGSSSNTTTTAASTTSKTESTFSFGGNSLAKSPAINFGTNISETKVPSFSITTTSSTAPTFGITSTTTTTTTPLINFGTFTAASGLTATTTTSPSINFGGTFGGQSTTSHKPSTAPPSMFGSSTTSTVKSISTPTATVTPTFGSPQVSKASTGFGSGSPFGVGTTTAISAPSFGNTTAVSTPAFGNNTTAISTPAFGSTTANSASVFGNTTTISAPTFGNTTSVFGTAPVTSAPVFGSGTTTTTTAPPTFGNITSSVFGTPATTAASVFGTPATTTASVFGVTSSTAPPTFGSTTSVFGSTAAATSTPMFGTATTTAASMFGSSISTTTSAPPTFGSTASGFGGTPPATSSSVFSRLGTKSTPAFGGTQSTAAPVFGATNSNPTFGSKNITFGASSQAPPPAYGTPSANSTFGQPQATFGATTANGPFGAATTTSTATAFGATSTFSFGANKPATANPFGAATTTSSSTFGTSNAFDATTKSGSTFGAPSANSNSFSSSTGGGFGTSAATFGGFGGTSAPTVFGQKDNNKAPFAFGGGENKANNNIGFGSGTANSAFSKPNTATGFGSTAASGFGTANATQQPQTNGGFNFGSNTSAAPFSFGGAATGTPQPAKPSFNFSGSTNPAPAFGNPNPAPTFGTTATPSFAAPGGAPSFMATGTPGAGAGVFNIGAGSTGGRPRTQLRAKRRT